MLVIDDSPITLDVVASCLGEQGWSIKTSKGGIEALERVRSFQPHVIVCDLKMPDIDGVQMVRKVREIDRTVPVVMLSAGKELGDILETVHAGVFDFIPKSSDARVLIAAVKRALVHSQMARENQRLARELAVVTARAALHRELEIAARVQTFSLPRRAVVPGLEIAARLIPAAEVGGDYYDIVPVEDGCWIAIGGVAGCGISAGVVALMIQSGISALASEMADAAPSRLVAAMNNMLLGLGRDERATLALLRYQRSGLVSFAGTCEQILVCPKDDGSCRRVDMTGSPLGVRADATSQLPVSELQLRPGDVVILYTDGVVEAVRGEERYGVDRLCAAVQRRRGLPAAQMQEEILAEVTAWAGVASDDLTLMVIRHLGG